VSYDLRIAAAVDPDEARRALAAEGIGDDLVFARDTLVAAIGVSAQGIGVEVHGHDAPPGERARDFAELLALLARVARRVGGEIHDPQLGRTLAPGDDAGGVVRSFA
jgi:hypothetical protein